MRIDLGEFGLKPDTKEDVSLSVYRALAACTAMDSPVLAFPAGRYDFHPRRAAEFHLYITNHDQGGTRKTAFPLRHASGLTIDGQGSEFVFHGPMIPFYLERCSNVTLRNFTIDWERPMFEQGVVTERTASSFEFRLAPGTPYEMRAEGLFFRFGDAWLPVWGLHDIDPVRRTHAFQSGDRISWSAFRGLKLLEAAPGVIRVTGDIRHFPEVGHVVAMRFGRRENPGIFAANCSGVTIEDVTLHHAPGMGFVAQRSSDITLRRFNVKLPEHSDRVVTATADATHFTNCQGFIRIEHCLFENQLDDPCNVHGVYVRIAEKVSDDTLLVRFMESMTVGIGFADPGDTVTFVRGDSLLPYAGAKVREVRQVNAEYVLLTLDVPLPPDIALERDVLENATWNADLTVRGCTVRANRARGFLITTPKKVLLENNTISAPGAGIKISGDANSWYESGAVRDVTIRGNTFLDCNYCYPDWGRAVIDIDPEIEPPLSGHHGFYHRNIRIEDNTFDTFESAIVHGHSVDGFTFRNNRVRRSGRYPDRPGQRHAIELQAVREADVSGNRFEAGGQTARLGEEELPL